MFENLKDQRPKTKDLSLRAEKGFTLIELSIVIVFIGLIVAGVVGGLNLIRQSKIRSIITDYEKYKVAANTFKLEYNGLPADFRRASAYGIGNDGNGDGFIHGRGLPLEELGHAWQHLKNAKLVPGIWTAGQNYFPGNSPPTAFGDDIYPIFTSIPRGHVSINNGNCIDTWWNALFRKHTAKNLIAFGRRDNGLGHPGQSYSCPQLGFLTVSEASGLDNKIDDGLPDRGILFVANHAHQNTNGNRCVDKSVQQGGPVNYDYDETGETCRLIFTLGM